MSVIEALNLQDWVGRIQTSHDVLDPARAARMAAVLDRRAPALGEVLPPLWHWVYFTEDAPQSRIGTDGHAKLGDFMPPVALPRRMRAGGRFTFHTPLHIGDRVDRVTEIRSVTEKSGRQGALVFVTLRHSLSNEAGLALTEEEDIVYREPSTTAMPAPAQGDPAPSDWREPVIPDPVMLFRYSAVTFNGHRIHYDLPYATGEEGYPGLVVHGPLTATLLLDSAIRQGAKPRSYAYRGTSPLFVGGQVDLCGTRTGDGFDLWAEGPGGYTAMTAKLEL